MCAHHTFEDAAKSKDQEALEGVGEGGLEVVFPHSYHHQERIWRHARVRYRERFHYKAQAHTQRLSGGIRRVGHTHRKSIYGQAN